MKTNWTEIKEQVWDRAESKTWHTTRGKVSVQIWCYIEWYIGDRLGRSSVRIHLFDQITEDLHENQLARYKKSGLGTGHRP
jgi:hypothetical protein